MVFQSKIGLTGQHGTAGEQCSPLLREYNKINKSDWRDVGILKNY
jgi:hypothetical protein